jgi:thiol reductant ABC exporter CydC subunit
MSNSAFRTPKSTFVRLLHLALPFKGWMALSVLLGALTIGSSIGLMAASAWIIATAALHPPIADLAVAIVGVRFFGIARGVFRYLERLTAHHVNFNLLARLRVWFYTAIEPLAPRQLLAYHSGDLLARIVGDIETLQNFFVRVIAPPLVASVIAIGMAVFLAGYAGALAIVVLTFMILIGVVMPVIVQRAGRSIGRQLISTRSELNAQLIDGLQGASDLIAFGQGGHQAGLVRKSNRELIQSQRRMASITALHTSIGGLLTHLALWSVLIVAIPLVHEARLSGVDLAVIALATLASFEGVLALPLAFQYLEANRQAARRLFEIVDASRTLPPYRPEGAIPMRLDHPSIRLTVDALSFRYQPDEALVLDRVSFDLTTGQTKAIVGPSGAGKSTLINLLLRLWDYDEGRITLNGIDLCDYEADEVRRSIGVVSQTTHLFNVSIRENLLLAKLDAREDDIIDDDVIDDAIIDDAIIDDAIIAAARQAQLHDFIQSLPDGYDTLIGEQGLRLSGGERQRLAVARALLKDAPVLLLDEATANLDPVTAREMMKALRASTRAQATLIITHQLIGLEDVDEILVLNRGRVIERGTHAELLEGDGLYRRLWEMQHQVLAP